jgi:hypothetical protein
VGLYYEAMSSLPVSARVTAVCLGFSGFLVAVTLPWHPSIFGHPVDEVVRGFAAWSALHAIAAIALILVVVGASGLVAVHEGRLGRSGSAGLVVTIVGTVGGACVFGVEALVFPVLSERAPDLLALDGPLLTAPLFVVAGLCALGWPLGLALLGVAALKAHVFRRSPCLLLALSGPAFLAFAGPFVPVAGPLSAAIFGLAQMWWGWLMWRTAAAPSPKPSTPGPPRL